MSRNLVFVVLDTVRKDYFDEHARRLRRLADASYERCYAASSWTVPSHGSMLTGKLPHQHGVHAHNVDLSDLPRRDVFLDSLTDHRVLGVSANANARVERGFDSYFDDFFAESFNRYGLFPGGLNLDRFAVEYDGLDRYVRFLAAAVREGEVTPSLVNGVLVKLHERWGWTPNLRRREDYGADAVVERALEHLNEEPFFLYLNFMEAHMPHQPVEAYDESLYSVPNSWTSYEVDTWELNNAETRDQYDVYLSNLRQLYAASVDYLDRRVADLVEAVDEGTTKETTVVVTSDHGENLGFDYEDGLVGHGAGGLLEGLLHVPLLVVNPPGDLPTDGLVSHLDLGDLCLGIVDGETPDITRQRVPAERIGLAGRDTLSDMDGFEYWDRAVRCVYEGDRKFLWDSTGDSRTFAVGEDPSTEVEIDSPPEVPPDDFEFFDEELQAYKERVRRQESGMRDDVDEVVRRRLQDLGYG